jgi:sugar phosphate isomerase/epimerase
MIVTAMRAAGVSFVEFNVRSLADTMYLKRKIGDLTAAFHLPFVHEDGYDFSCADHRKEIQDLIYQLNSEKDALHIRHAVVHPPEGPDQSEKAWRILMDHLRHLEMPVYLENVFGGPTAQFQEHFHKARTALGRQLAGLCFDACHFYIDGKDPVEQWRHWHAETGCVHLSDCLANDDAHLPFGLGGTLPINPLLAAMKSTGFSGSITLEIKPPSTAQIDSYLQTYCHTLKVFNYKKYWRTRLRLRLIKPALSFLLNGRS